MTGDDAELVSSTTNSMKRSKAACWHAWRKMSGCTRGTKRCAARDPDRGVAQCPTRKCAASSAARHASFVECRSRGPPVVLRRCSSRSRGRICPRPAGGGRGGMVGFSGAPSDDRADWRSAVAEYMELYTNETFALRNPDQTIEALKLNVVAKRGGCGPDAREGVASRPSFRVRRPTLIRRSIIGRNRVCRLPRLASAVLHHRQWRSRHRGPLGEARRPCDVLMVAWRTRLSGDRAHARRADRRIGPDAQDAVLERPLWAQPMPPRAGPATSWEPAHRSKFRPHRRCSGYRPSCRNRSV
jgi:hypothetical protein